MWVLGDSTFFVLLFYLLSRRSEITTMCSFLLSLTIPSAGRVYECADQCLSIVQVWCCWPGSRFLIFGFYYVYPNFLELNSRLLKKMVEGEPAQRTNHLCCNAQFKQGTHCRRKEHRDKGELISLVLLLHCPITGWSRENKSPGWLLCLTRLCKSQKWRYTTSLTSKTALIYCIYTHGLFISTW